eukprot:sb/3468998/
MSKAEEELGEKDEKDSTIVEEKETKGADEVDETDNRPVCEAFTEWSCQHGIAGNKLINGKKCPDKHLPACKKFLKFGTSENGCTVTNCQLFHPNLCRFIQTDTSCFDVKCKSYHPFSFNKSRRDAIKAKATRDKASTGTSKSNDKSRNKKKPSVESSNERKNKRNNSEISDFRKLQDLISKLIVRMDSLEKRVEEIPRERMQSSESINPSQFQKVPIPQPQPFLNPWQAWNVPRQFAQPACY